MRVVRARPPRRPPGRDDLAHPQSSPSSSGGPPCPIQYGTATDAWRPADDDGVPAGGDDDDNGGAGTFVYFDGATVPDDVVRLRVDPSVVAIPPMACEGRARLVEVQFSEGLQEIHYRAFANCTALVGPLRIPSSVKILHERAFEYCTSLTEVILQNGLEEIRNFAFRGCTSLTHVRNWGTKTKVTLREVRAPTEVERERVGLVHPDAMLHTNYGYEIGSETTLRPVLNSFATKRGVPLRSLRFAYKGRTMFLSDLKNETPKKLGMSLQNSEDEVIHVVVVPEEANADGGRDAAAVQRQQMQSAKVKKKKSRVARNRSKVKKGQVRQDNPAMSLEDYKKCHSMILTRLHEEVQPRLKDIRTKLNALDLERQPPKSKNMGGRECAKEGPIDHDTLLRSGVGGKAGRSHFVVMVGEVQNLYKTTKSSVLASSHQNQSSVPTLDLHGCSREEAITKLNESLEVWVDTAMRGYDPFVITAVIVCGCGSQILSETVQEWIKSTSQVRNAPKNHLF